MHGVVAVGYPVGFEIFTAVSFKMAVFKKIVSVLVLRRTCVGWVLVHQPDIIIKNKNYKVY